MRRIFAMILFLMIIVTVCVLGKMGEAVAEESALRWGMTKEETEEVMGPCDFTMGEGSVYQANYLNHTVDRFNCTLILVFLENRYTAKMYLVEEEGASAFPIIQLKMISTYGSDTKDIRQLARCFYLLDGQESYESLLEAAVEAGSVKYASWHIDEFTDAVLLTTSSNSDVVLLYYLERQY